MPLQGPATSMLLLLLSKYWCKCVVQVARYLPEFFLICIITAYTLLTAVDLYKALRAQRLQAALLKEGSCCNAEEGQEEGTDPYSDSSTNR